MPSGAGGGGPNLHPETPREPRPGPDDAARAARQQRLQELAADPAHGGKVDAKTLREAEVGLSLEERGAFAAPIRRDPTGSAEFIDATGQKWDVKAWNSRYAPRGYNTADAIAAVRREVAAGENVMVDTANMSAEHIRDLQAALAAQGLTDKVIFF